MHLALASSAQFMRLGWAHGVIVSRDVANEMAHAANLALFAFCELGCKPKPKMHAWAHMVEDMQSSAGVFNFVRMGCWGQEDHIGKIMRIAKASSAKAFFPKYMYKLGCELLCRL